MDEGINVIDIESRSNAKIKEWYRLLKGKGIKKEERIIISGRKLVSEMITYRKNNIRECIIKNNMSLPDDLPQNASCFRLSGELFDELDVNGTHYPLIVSEIPPISTFNEDLIDDRIIILVPFQDPANVGAIIRSSAAFGIKTVVLLKEAANPFHPKSLRAAGTQIFMVDLYKYVSITDIKFKKYSLAALTLKGENISGFTPAGNIALLAGLEGEGIPENINPKYKLTIPIRSGVDSLNAAVALSISIYELTKNRI